MPAFSADAKPKVSEFGLSLSITWHQSRKTLKSRDADELLDTSVLWRILRPADLDAARDQLDSLEGKRYDATIQVVVRQKTFRAIHASLADATTPDAPDIANALAAA